MSSTVQDYSPLLEGVLTVSDRDVFLDQLGEVEERMFKPAAAEAMAGKQGGVAAVLEVVFPYERKTGFVNLLHQEEIEVTDLVKIQDVIKAVREYLGSVPVLWLTLAESPRESLLKKIAMSVSDQTQQPLFLDITIDTSILGGSKLEWGGKVVDFSLEKKLRDYFGNLKNQQEGKPMEVN